MNGYKLLLVPVDEIDASWPGPQEEALVVTGHGDSPLRVGPFPVIADVGEDKQIRMSRPVYEQVQVVG